ncbi:IS3 family transposase [Chryseobacterium zhengzhouense]|uniref:IS3 family transposase n=1 Tax=Chryseobacterium zhengzhouense TaxID=1636086 RepID=A0ABW2M798_9FLAO
MKKEIKQYITYYNNDRIRLKSKWKEPGTVPNSFL